MNLKLALVGALMAITIVRWLVVIVVVYTASTMLRTTAMERERSL